MTDIIRKAVELADGWSIGDTGFLLAPGLANVPLHLINQCRLDALAAQLVRQVDALDRLFVDSDPYGTAKVWAQESGLGMGRIAKANDEDRTMNTIKAIVESGVLDQTSQGEDRG